MSDKSQKANNDQCNGKHANSFFRIFPSSWTRTGSTRRQVEKQESETKINNRSSRQRSRNATPLIVTAVVASLILGTFALGLSGTKDANALMMQRPPTGNSGSPTGNTGSSGHALKTCNNAPHDTQFDSDFLRVGGASAHLMKTSGVLRSDGRIDALTETVSRNVFGGFTGAAGLILYDCNDVPIGQTHELHRFGVDGTAVGNSDRQDQWTESVSPDLAARTDHIRPYAVWAPNWNKALQNVETAIQVGAPIVISLFGL